MSLNARMNSPQVNGPQIKGPQLSGPQVKSLQAKGGRPDLGSLESVCRSVAELARSAPEPPSRIKVQHGATTVEIEWPAPAQVSESAPARVGPTPVPDPAPDGELTFVCAPMVGTFYHAREPGAPPLVAVGDLVQPGQAVGILEVMKMMSVIEAEVSGRVVEVLVPDAQPVEFQQHLISLEPAPPGDNK